MDPKVILETALNREEITAIEALLLLQEGERICPELFDVADTLTRRVTNNTVTYVRGRRVTYTNICRAECSFCSFWRKRSQKSAFSLTVDEVIRQIKEANGVRQITLQGGLNPDLTLTFHVELLRTIRDEFPRLHIQGYSPSEIHFIARRSRTSTPDVLRRFREAGLDSMPGDSADILNDKVRKKICPDKLRTNDWIEIMKTAHRLGISTTSTILFGHVEDEIHVCEHLEIIKNIQKDTGGVTAFQPVPFIPTNTALARGKKIKSPPPLESTLRLIAIARIFFCKLVRNIQVDWTKLTLPGAIQAISVGANDLGPLGYDPYEIRLPEVNGRVMQPAATVRSAIQKAGRTPAEREPYSMKTVQTVKPKREELVLV